MAKKEIAIALNFTSNGEQKVIKNLQQLETELSKLQTELKTLDFGSPAFKEATTNINRLKSQIKDIDKATEGLESAQRIQAIGEAVSIAVSSFQILSGVIGLFITDQEDLEAVQRAEATALQVLNVAIGVNTIVYQNAELAAKGLSFQTIVLTAIQKAYGNVVKTATAIQLAYNAALKANPIGVVVVSVLALTAAIYGLLAAFKGSNKEQEKAKQIAETLNAQERELIKTRIEAAKDLEFQLKILTDNVSTRALELKIINDLKKSYPGFNAFVDKNNNLNKDGITFLKETIRLKQVEASLNAIAAAGIQEEIRLQQAVIDIRNEEGFTTRGARLIQQERDKSKATLVALTQLETQYTAELNTQLELLTPLNEKLEKQAEAESKTKDAISQTTLAIQNQNKFLVDRIKLYEIITNRLGQLQSAELNFSTDVLEKQNEILELQNQLLQNRRDELGLTNDVLDEISALFFQSIPDAEQAEQTSSAIFDLFNTIREAYGTGKLNFSENLGFDEFLEFFKNAKPEAKNFIELLKNIPEATQASFVEFFNSYKGRVDEITKLIGTQEESISTLFNQSNEKYFKLLVDVEKQQSDLFKNRINNGKTENQILEQGRELIKLRLNLITEEQQRFKEISDLRKTFETANEKDKQAIQDRINLLIQEGQSINEIVDTILLGVVRNNKFVESILEAEKAFKKTNIQIKKNKEDIDKTFDPVLLEQYFKTYGDGVEEVLKAFVLDSGAFLERFGEEGTQAILRGVVDGIKEQGKLTRQEVEKTIDILEQAAIGIKLAFGNSLNLDNFTEQIEYLRRLLKGLPNELTPLQKTFQDIEAVAQKIIGAFLDLSNRLQQTIQASNSLLLEQLAQDEARALASIGDASVRARELRIEEEKKFAKQRFEIEKRARIQELNFATANAIADSAGAIINALATIPPPASIVYATLLAALTATQVQVIANQRTSVQSQQFVARRGGLVSGQSHEGSNGGVPVLLEGGEFIVNREAVNRFGDQISDLNSATGGRRLSIDDSRLVQAISSQNMTSSPLKAYVLYNDIQSTEKLNKKITQLSRL